MTRISEDQTKIVVCALYQFVALADLEQMKQPLEGQMHALNIRGTLLLASEGINGTVAGTRSSIEALLTWFKKDQRFEQLNYKFSYHDEIPYYRTKVKLKKEIITMGIASIDPRASAGTYIRPEDWNQLIEDPDVLLIDTRNYYEIGIGTFKHAVNPHTTSFREFPDYVRTQIDPKKHKQVAMFCTGGIRCEKSAAFLKQQGFEDVYHLQGGILKYLEKVPENESLWRGECFVFDNRVSVNHQLQRGEYDQCHACRMPITEQDKCSEDYVPGISCPHCAKKLSAAQRARFQEREKQVQLAKIRGESHIGTDAVQAQQAHKISKTLIKQLKRR